MNLRSIALTTLAIFMYIGLNDIPKIRKSSLEDIITKENKINTTHKKNHYT
ncbi:MAG: hypothetical protein KatS3mg002_0561 [Candidatus Woesearchaeota archaeon]|nr:MAG: hypothetical protein KatS3mg002_0561 [Candidatus Woesearchaeota archaeon]